MQYFSFRFGFFLAHSWAKIQLSAQYFLIGNEIRIPSIPRSTRSSCIYIQLRKPRAAVNSSKFISIRVLWPTIIIQFILSIECFLWYIFFHHLLLLQHCVVVFVSFHLCVRFERTFSIWINFTLKFVAFILQGPRQTKADTLLLLILSCDGKYLVYLGDFIVHTPSNWRIRITLVLLELILSNDARHYRAFVFFSFTVLYITLFVCTILSISLFFFCLRLNLFFFFLVMTRNFSPVEHRSFLKMFKHLKYCCHFHRFIERLNNYIALSACWSQKYQLHKWI